MTRWFALVGASFAVTALLIFGALEAFLRLEVLPFDQSIAHFQVYRDVRSGSAIFGDSRAANGLDGGDDFVNLARPGDPLAAIETKVSHYFGRHAPRRVVVQVDAAMFNASAEQWTPDRLKDHMRAYDYDVPIYLLHPWLQPRVFEYLKYFLHGGRYEESRVEPNGFRPLFGSIAEWPEARVDWYVGRHVEQGVPPPPSLLAETPAFRSLASTLTMLASRGAGACVVLLPVSVRLQKAQEQVPEYRLFRTFLAEQMARLGATFVDFESEVLPDDRYYDVSHLNEKGAHAISSRILANCFGTAP